MLKIKKGSFALTTIKNYGLGLSIYLFIHFKLVQNLFNDTYKQIIDIIMYKNNIIIVFDVSKINQFILLRMSKKSMRKLDFILASIPFRRSQGNLLKNKILLQANMQPLI